MTKKKPRGSMQWYAMDLHLHTPASIDYQQPGVSFLDILKRAEARGLDIIAFADHNTRRYCCYEKSSQRNQAPC